MYLRVCDDLEQTKCKKLDHKVIFDAIYEFCCCQQIWSYCYSESFLLSLIQVVMFIDFAMLNLTLPIDNIITTQLGK